MKKQYLIVETTAVEQAHAEEAAGRDEPIRPGLLRADAPERPRREIPAPQRQRAHNGLDPNRYVSIDASALICYAFADAEEYIDEQLARNPGLKFVVYESVAFMEVAPSPTIKKEWDQNGELRVRG